jgi:hypothetical protein
MTSSKRGFVDSTSTDPSAGGELFLRSESGERLESGAPAGEDTDCTALPDLLAQNEHAALVRQVAIDQALFLRDCVRTLAKGRTKRRWAVATRPVLQCLLRAVDALDASTLVPDLVTLDALLDRATRASDVTIDEGTREALLAAHARVDAEIARVFDLSFEPVFKARR